jgi:uncharacterized protein YraI
MRLRFATLLLLCSLPMTAAAEPPSFPYKAYINADGVYVRSGPGNNYYPTDKLDSGAEVEVHRHDPGGWFAIRPPEGSFTWVSNRYLDIGRDGLATINADRVAARVGSRFSDIRDVIQIRLERGELVEILETKTIPGDPESTTWCKIAPPSGEFRWVFGKYVDPVYAQAGIRRASREANPMVPPPDDRGPAPMAYATPAPRVAGMHPLPPPDETSPGLAPRLAEAKPGGPEPPPMRRLSPEEFQAELDRLNLEFSTMLVEEPTVWECQSLLLRGEELLAQAETAVERGRTRLLVNRIRQAHDIEERQKAITTAQLDAERQDRLLADLSHLREPVDPPGGPTGAPLKPQSGRPSPKPAGKRPAMAADRRFDGMGRLTRVVPPKLGAPQYALVDDKGAVRCYVTPAPGVNLQYYVGRRVGINGTRGFMPEQKAQHVTAKHITNLDQRIVR